MKASHQVIVVGGGPVGLWLACELKLAGIDVAVVERRTKRVNQSRALTIHGRTLEVFSLRGLEARFLSRGKPIPMGHFGVLDTRIDFSKFESRFPYTLFIPQAQTETLIEERALELGVHILRGHVVKQILSREEEVVVEGDGFQIAGRYLIGADGARSVVRSAAEIDFPGYPVKHTYMLGDVVLEMPEGLPVISTVSGAGCIMVAPLGDGVHHRIVIMDPERSATPLSEPVTIEELKSSTSKILGTDLHARDPIWLSRFADETRLAETYRKGRIFLAGDSGHIHLPAGGQGMNVGIQDAMNLGWKLAAVLNGHAHESLLDSYEAERRPVGERLHTNTLAQASIVSTLDPAGIALRTMLSEFLQIPELNERLAAELSGFGLSYPDVSGDDVVGARIPDEDLVLTDGTAATLYGPLFGGKWMHLSLQPGARAVAPAWLDAAAVTDVEARRVTTGGQLEGISAVLIRPDGYAAAVARA